MSDGDQSITVEGFVTDLAFVDQTKLINGLFVDDGANVASLTNKALSYFTTPAVFADSRAAAARQVNWSAQSEARLVVDSGVFSAFVATINNLSGTTPIGIFKIIDKLLFDYDPTVTHATLEAALLADADMASVYVPGSFSLSSIIVSDTVYTQGGGTKQVQVPSYANFTITLPTGTTTTQYVLRLYTSVAAWIKQYSVSSIVQVVAPLPYDKLLNASLVTATDNIFATSNTTATLSYNTTQAIIGNTTISGMSEYRAVVTDGVNNVIAPFNILYKGRAPTLYEIRGAIAGAVLGSGVGDTTSWKARIPGIFVLGRFYVLPLWDQTYTKPDQKLFPNIAKLDSYGKLTNTMLGSLGYGDVSQYTDVISIYYNRMTATVIPDLSGTVDIHHLIDLIPDYQSYSPSDAQFSFMLPITQLFARDLNTVLTIDSGAQVSDVYAINTEGDLSFYSFTVGSYEICVISKLCYTTIAGSLQ